MSRSRISLLLSPLLLLLTACRQVPVVNPDPIAMPAKNTQEQVAKSIKAALLRRQCDLVAEIQSHLLSCFGN